jgi:hypothetical protein
MDDGDGQRRREAHRKSSPSCNRASQRSIVWYTPTMQVSAFSGCWRAAATSTAWVAWPRYTTRFEQPIAERDQLWIRGAGFGIGDIHRQPMRQKAKGCHQAPRCDVIGDQRVRTNGDSELRGSRLEQKGKCLETLPRRRINPRHAYNTQPVCQACLRVSVCRRVCRCKSSGHTSGEPCTRMGLHTGPNFSSRNARCSISTESSERPARMDTSISSRGNSTGESGAQRRMSMSGWRARGLRTGDEIE